MTLREVTIAYDARLIADWDHTASTLSMLHNIGVIIMHLGSKHCKAEPKAPVDFHPYRKRQMRGLLLTKENYRRSLKLIGRVFCMQRT